MTKHLRFLIVLLMTLVWSAGGAQTTVFHETFDKCNSTGGNDGAWGASSGGNELSTSALISQFLDNKWSNVSKVYIGNKCVKLSTRSAIGTLTTPLINSTGDFIIKIKAGACSSKSGELTVKTTAGTLDKSSVSLTADKFNEYRIELSGVTKAFTLAFSIPSKKQSFIDDIEVINKASAVTKKDPGISFGETTYTANITDKDETYHSYVTLTNPNNLSVSYASSKIDVAEVNNNGEVKILGVGTTTISAAFAGDDTYMKATVSYELTVVDPNAKENVVVFTAGKEKGKITAKGDERDEMSSKGVTVSGTVIALGNNDDYRFYQGCEFTISVTTGTITKILFVGTGSDTKYSLANLKATGYKAADAKNGTWIGNAREVTFTAGAQARATSITVYVSIPSGVTLDETATNNTIEAKKGVNVTLKRTMKADMWNTIYLPFAVTMDKAKAAFGDNVKIVELDTKAAVDANVLSFKASTGIEAATPYLIKPSAVSETGTYTFDGVDITETNDENAYSFNNVKNPIAFKGIYNMVDITTDVTTIGGNYYAAFLGANNTIFKAAGGKMKGFRAYFAIPYGTSASALRVVIDGTATSIKNIDSEVVESNAPVYNLQGQRVDGSNLTPGIYVKAGKKFVVK